MEDVKTYLCAYVVVNINLCLRWVDNGSHSDSPLCAMTNQWYLLHLCQPFFE